jgi:hypothetical protein
MAERKTAAERAQALVDSAKSKVERLQAQHDKIVPKADAVKQDLADAKAELEFAQGHPALAGGASQPVEEVVPQVEAETAVVQEARASEAIGEPEPKAKAAKAAEPAPAPTLAGDDDPFA